MCCSAEPVVPVSLTSPLPSLCACCLLHCHSLSLSTSRGLSCCPSISLASRVCVAGMPESGAACDASLVYFERQDLTSALCAVHCLNNLLQSPLFTAMDLSGAAAELNERERLLRAESGTDSAAYLDWLSAEGGNAYASDSGNFSLSVIQQCLQVVDLSCSRMLPAASASPPPSSVIAVIANLEAHWLVCAPLPRARPATTAAAALLRGGGGRRHSQRLVEPQLAAPLP